MAEFKIRFDKGETGWAELAGPGRAKILNIPCADGLNIHDVVALIPAKDGDFPSAGEVLHREYDHKAVVELRSDAELQSMWEIMKSLGGVGEGMAPPKDGKPGWGLAAWTENPITALALKGFQQPAHMQKQQTEVAKRGKP